MGSSQNSFDIILQEPIVVDREPPVNLSEKDRDDYGEMGRYETYESVLRCISNVRVSSASLFYKNLVVDPKSLYSRQYKTYYQTKHLAKNFLFGKNVVLGQSENYLLATDQESEGHFHWLTEVLPRLWPIRERAHEFVLLLPDKPYVRTIGLESLALLGFHFVDIVWMRDDQFFKVPNLYHISKVSPSGQMHDGVMSEIRRAFIGDPLRGSKCIYISRGNARRRRVLNDAELIAMLSTHGFEIFTGDGMNLREQIELFSECRVVVGIHGAGLTNCLFMQRGTVVELKKKELTYAYWNLAGSLGHEYYYYNGVPDSDQSLMGTGCNLKIPVEEFEKTILGKISK